MNKRREKECWESMAIRCSLQMALGWLPVRNVYGFREQNFLLSVLWELTKRSTWGESYCSLVGPLLFLSHPFYHRYVSPWEESQVENWPCEKSKSHASVGFMEEIRDHPPWEVGLHANTSHTDRSKWEGWPAFGIHCHLGGYLFTQRAAKFYPSPCPQHSPWSVLRSWTPAPRWFVCCNGDMHRLTITRSKHLTVNLLKCSLWATVEGKW